MTPRRHHENSLRRRKKNTREQERRFLIYVEGENTERIYLQGLRRELRRHPITVKLGPKHGEPKGLVRAARKHAQRVAGDPAEVFDEVWCVMDVEAPQQAPGLEEALAEARKWGIRCALSNPCFELWLILHFQDQAGHLTSAQAQTRLAGLLPGYSATNGKSFSYEAVREHRGRAVLSARTLSDRHRCPGEACRENPCTSVTGLLDALGLA